MIYWSVLQFFLLFLAVPVTTYVSFRLLHMCSRQNYVTSCFLGNLSYPCDFRYVAVVYSAFKFSWYCFCNLVTICYLGDIRHCKILKLPPLQIDFEQILSYFFSSQTIDVAIIRSNLTLTRVCSQSQQKTFIQSCLVVTFSLLILSCNLELCVQFAYTCYIYIIYMHM